LVGDEAAMAIGPNHAEAATAFNRFGLGARPGDLDAAAADPRAYVLEELRTADAALVRDPALPSGPEVLETYYLDQQQQRVARAKAATASPPPTANATAGAELAPSREPMAMAPAGGPSNPIGTTSPLTAMAPRATAPASLASSEPKPMKAEPHKPSAAEVLFRAEAEARLRKQLQARVGFVERLVAFWSNHFAVSVAKSNALRVAAGPFEREAIRPNALGKFAALLRAAESHPAMIFYLDNQNSIGPDAPPGKFAGRGLNENLAREILELHTVGVGSGYTQADVAELARVLTGWSVAGPESEAGAPGAFVYKPNWHEPGARQILGKTYAQNGVDQAHAVLDDLARHPATARHIATKLARHFIADNPPADLVETLTRKFVESDGDLAVVASALISDDRAWSAKPTKIRTPLEFVVAAARVTGFQPKDANFYLQGLNMLGMPLWQPGGPNGFSDMSDTWASAEGMKARLDLASSMGQRMRTADPVATMNAGLGATVSRDTRQAIERAESRGQALALLLMAPEFQRR
jgi:uncharacterized protein (DUF1800 family)